MVYGYIRVSTEKQTCENQRFEIERFCAANGIKVEKWIEETISGTKTPDKRLLGALLNEVQKGDLIICSELSRLGRSMLMIMSILNQLMTADVRIWTIKDNYRLGDNIQAKVLAFAFGISAEIERELISQRTKEALARRKANGIKLGRPFGSRSRIVKLSGREQEIQLLLNKQISKSAIGRMLGVDRGTVQSFLRRNNMN
ncbi:MAG: master DNA invertase Mpi family serine-type recombinase [Treponemataceae bacterium]|nr:MAG: master DNA invertase Mpi family serine-type recombinase [Treponemataceae bacterium]